MSAPIKPTTRTRQQWAQHLNKVWDELTHTTVEDFFRLGCDLLQAKEDLLHGEFIKMVNEDLEMIATSPTRSCGLPGPKW
jgi:hypothetical protein